MGFLPILNRYDMGYPSGKTKVKTFPPLFAPHLFACTNGCVSQYNPEQIYKYEIYIYINVQIKLYIYIYICIDNIYIYIYMENRF